jgi:hypothetical protein
MVPNGKVRCAAVSFSGENLSPLAVIPPFWVQIAAMSLAAAGVTSASKTAMHAARLTRGLAPTADRW